MVAYNFKPQFAPLVESGVKRQTIRARGKRRHARPGEALQLYTGQRTKACRKLIAPDPKCTLVEPLIIILDKETGLDIWFEDQRRYASFDELEAIAIADGFGYEKDDPLDEFIRFFEPRCGGDGMESVQIKW
ncbi:MAG: ASCH domain-containing protein [Cyanobacteria bacterium P01_C01_bin.120]